MKDIILKLIDQLPSILIAAASLIGAVFAYRNGKKSDAIQTQSVANGQKADELKTQGTEIHGLVNGNLAQLNEQLAAARTRVAELERERGTTP